MNFDDSFFDKYARTPAFVRAMQAQGDWWSPGRAESGIQIQLRGVHDRPCWIVRIEPARWHDACVVHPDLVFVIHQFLKGIKSVSTVRNDGYELVREHAIDLYWAIKLKILKHPTDLMDLLAEKYNGLGQGERWQKYDLSGMVLRWRPYRWIDKQQIISSSEYPADMISGDRE